MVDTDREGRAKWLGKMPRGQCGQNKKKSPSNAKQKRISIVHSLGQ